MAKVGIALSLISLGVFIIYGVYSLLSVIYNESDVPLVLRISIPVMVTGVAMLLIAVVRERLADRKRENFKGVEF